MLAKLEQEDRAAPKGFEDLPLFAAPYKPSAEMQEAAHDLLAAAIAALNPDDMSPRDAMEALYRLKEQLAKTRQRVMMNIAERKQTSALADAQGWLAQFEAALQAQDAAAAAALFLADGLWRDLLAFTWTIQTMAGRAAIEKDARRDACAHQAEKLPHSAAAHAAALGQPRRHRCHRSLVRFRDRLRPLQRRAAAGARWPRAIARLDAEHQSARAARP